MNQAYKSQSSSYENFANITPLVSIPQNLNLKASLSEILPKNQ